MIKPIIPISEVIKAIFNNLSSVISIGFYYYFKVKIADRISKETANEIPVEVDGGINRETLHLVTEAGANIIVMGNAIFTSDNPKEVIDFLREGK